MAGRSSVAVGVVERSSFTVMYGGLPTTAWYCWSRICWSAVLVLDGVDRRSPTCLVGSEPRCSLHLVATPVPAAAEQQAVAGRQVDLPAGGLLQPLDAAGLHGGDDQPEPSDRHGERVDVHAPDAVECLLGGDDLVVSPASSTGGTAGGTRRAGSGPSRRSGRSAAPSPARTRRGPGRASGRG